MKAGMSETPQNVAQLATKQSAIDLDGIALLGTTVEADGPKALVRTSGGQVRKVAPGDRVGLARVRAIGAGMVQISGLGGTETLTMPNG